MKKTFIIMDDFYKDESEESSERLKKFFDSIENNKKNGKPAIIPWKKTDLYP